MTEHYARPSLQRSPPSIQLTTCNVLALDNTTLMKRSRSSASATEISRTQHKLMLQRHSFLADDKNYLDHPDNMRRLTKELERVNREYRCVKQFQDPLALSIKRVTAIQQQQYPSSSSSSSLSVSNSPLSSAASSWSSSSSSFLLTLPPQLQRRASSHTVHDYLLHFSKEERRHSFSFLADNKSSLPPPAGLMGRLFGSTSNVHHPSLPSPLVKRQQ